MTMAYVIRVHVGDTGKSNLITKLDMTSEKGHAPWVFKYKDQAAMKAREIRNGNSLGLWFSIEPYKGE